VTDVPTTFRARLYGEQAARDRAKKALAAAQQAAE
jgi:predicted site-specific integrase-resolvase